MGRLDAIPADELVDNRRRRRLVPWWLRRLAAKRLRYVPVVIRADLEGLTNVVVERLPGGWVQVTYQAKATRDHPFRAHRRRRPPA